MIGNGAEGGQICSNTPFVQILEKIGDTIDFTFPGGNMSCAKTIMTKCGAPAIRVLPSSIGAYIYKVWFLEYDSTQIEVAEKMFTEDVPFDSRNQTGVMAGMAKLDQEFWFSGLASDHVQGYPGY